ncbi:MAG: hypothetical protein NTV34_17135, partial [Proteobacteria bacterium]|nr:hypothetical protein [Pseudomonadota bacterium]
MQVIRLLPVVFLCAGAVVAVDQFLQDRLLGLRDARNIIIASVGQSRARLVNGLWQAASDSIIQQGVADRNINSLSQTLQNYLRPGEVSQIEILDSECNLLVRVSGSKKPLPSGCRPGDGARFGLKWQQGSDEIPTLSMALPKTMGGLSVVFLAHLALDQAWLSAHPELFNLLASNKYSLYETSPHGVVWRDGVSSQGQALIELRVAGWIGRFLPDFTRYSLNFPSTPLWWIFSMVGAIIALSIGQARMAEKRDRVHRRRFLAWAARYPELGHQSDADKMSPE